MKTSMITKTLGVLALLGSSAGMAATINITASPGPTAVAGLYNVGDNFTLTLTGDIANTFTGTMAMAFDATKVAFVSGAVLAPFTVFTKNSPVTANPTVFDVERPTSSGPAPGIYSIAVLTFTTLAEGNPNILINDDGGNVSGWFDDSIDANHIPVDYNQASVSIIPIPAAAWLFLSALGGLAGLKRRVANV